MENVLKMKRLHFLRDHSAGYNTYIDKSQTSFWVRENYLLRLCLFAEQDIRLFLKINASIKVVLLLPVFFLLYVTNVSAIELVFDNGSSKLTGHYLNNLDHNPPKGVIIFVHGDGALSYDAEGYYSIIWSQLRKNGYSIFSWDKAGVGKSTGHWLSQSMKDRQMEVLSAVELIQKKYGFTSKNTGLLGFSQAGWVVPKLAGSSNRIGFAIGVGFAQNWIDQGRYYTRIKHERRGAGEQQVQAAIEQYNTEIASFNSSPIYSKQFAKSGMSKQRFAFVVRNYKSDAANDYQKINIPMLLLWGENDLNVDAIKEFNRWTKNPNKNVTIKLIADATHGLLKSEYFDSQHISFSQWLKLMWLQQDALAPQVIPVILDWLDTHVNSNK